MLNLFTPLQNTRSKNLRVEKPNYKIYETFPSVKIPKIWNSWAGDLRSLNSSKAAKKHVKNKCITKYKHFNAGKESVIPVENLIIIKITIAKLMPYPVNSKHYAYFIIMKSVNLIKIN